MRCTNLAAFALLAAGLATGVPATALAEDKSGTPLQWEYRVLSREQVAELGRKDVAAGLNKLGEEGWELVAIEPAVTPAPGSGVAARPAQFYLKRLKVPESWRASARRRVLLAESDVEMWRDRVAWSERMVKKGFLPEREVQAERDALRAAEAVLDEARRELDRLAAPPRPAPTKERKRD